MALNDILQIVQTVSVVLAIAVAFSTLKDRGDDKTIVLTEMKVDLKYIKERLDGYEATKTDLTKALQSAASAHKRLDDHLRYDHHKDIPQREKD